MHCWRPERRAGAWLPALAALACAGLLAGCGGNEKRDFRVEQLNPLVKRMGEERATLAAVLRASRPGRARDARALRDQLGRLRAVMRRIAALEPPEGTEERFRRYTRANTAFLAALERFVDAYADDSARRQREAARETQTRLAAANRLQRQLQNALQ